MITSNFDAFLCDLIVLKTIWGCGEAPASPFCFQKAPAAGENFKKYSKVSPAPRAKSPPLEKFLNILIKITLFYAKIWKFKGGPWPPWPPPPLVTPLFMAQIFKFLSVTKPYRISYAYRKKRAVVEILIMFERFIPLALFGKSTYVSEQIGKMEMSYRRKATKAIRLG